MKKGFTMVELIFVIVILGLLSAIAIPKLNATRDDAEQAKLAINIATLMGDFASYYTSKGSFYQDGTAASMRSVTNINLDSDGNLKVKSVPCLKFEIASESKIKIIAPSGANSVCTMVLSKDGIKAIISDISGKVPDTTGIFRDYSTEGVVW